MKGQLKSKMDSNMCDYMILVLYFSVIYSPSVWLVTPLISKLPESVLGRVLKSAGNVLGQGQWWNPEKNQEKRRSTRATRYVHAVHIYTVYLFQHAMNAFLVG